METWLAIIIGGVIRAVQGCFAASPTFIVGLFIAAIFRFYLGPSGIHKLFGDRTFRGLPQSWAIGMLLPVCSIGVIPILIEMRRARIHPASISAFALSAPLFNPLSLLYGLTLSRPFVILFFAFGSLVIVTLLGLLWRALLGKIPDEGKRRDLQSSANNASQGHHDDWISTNSNEKVIGVTRLFAIVRYLLRQSIGAASGWALLSLVGLALVGMALPWGSMQHSVEQSDNWAPTTMTLVSVPIYATPMLTMSQLGMMFQHANSPGAAFVLLVLGTGLNLGTMGWFACNYGFKPAALWFSILITTVLTIAYSINQPLIPQGVTPAGHTHAFDIYTTPIPPSSKIEWSDIRKWTFDDIHLPESITTGLLFLGIIGGIGLRLTARETKSETFLTTSENLDSLDKAENESKLGFDRIVSPTLVGAVMLAGLVAFSIVLCYAYYPSSSEALEEIRIARTETLSGASSGDTEHALYWLKIWDDWSRRMEVGTYLRKFKVRPYQRMQGYLLRKKLEDLEHELEHDPFEPEEVRRVINGLFETNQRWAGAFQT